MGHTQKESAAECLQKVEEALEVVQRRPVQRFSSSPVEPCHGGKSILDASPEHKEELLLFQELQISAEVGSCGFPKRTLWLFQQKLLTLICF